WFTLSAGYRVDWHIWLSSMEAESARHPIGVANLRPFILYSFLAAPLIFLALPIAAWKEWRERGWSLLLLAAAVGWFGTGMLFFNYSVTINWRYFLTGLPGMAPLVGNFFVSSEAKKLGSERRGFLTAVVGVILVAALMGLLIRPKGNQYFNRLALAKTY